MYMLRLTGKPKIQRRYAATDTLFGEKTLFEGSCTSEADMRIEGEVTGDLHTTGEVVIGEKGFVRSTVTARDVIIAGRMEGVVKADGIVRITATGRLIGTVHAGSLIIEKGALFQGTSQMAVMSGDRISPCTMV
ncbi:bactofilin family protein [Paenibacillus radicis (ex Xue et al. 2023)]|uniref:Polymer-forming cytoskeletal protein n=1 Tax=Paenibacillus radicis (ex Xue et al. 2023) TaxID=2972489 RepID=A0ABT1YU33_9BACL|nr:polymer-forming cytoskeletal protein [Paenibacillus radicis (ex Xue et al. 2023)]MCR8636700.1 polymer-forming cytoskeletal protein [Paenibacillus radicis (ex Xue et al. 2023)]